MNPSSAARAARGINDETGTLLDPLELLRIYTDRKRLILGIVLAVVFLTTLVAYLAPRSYISTAQLVIARNEPDVVDTDSDRPITALQRGEMIATEAEILTSEGLVERTLAEHTTLDVASTESNPLSVVAKQIFALLRGLGLIDASDNPIAERVHQLAKSIEVTDHVDANTLVVEFKHDSPDVAQHALEALLDTYVGFRIEASQRPALKTHFAALAEETERRMETLQTELLSLQRDSGMVRPQIELDEAVGYLAELRGKAVDLELERHAVEQGLERLNEILGATPLAGLIQEERARNPEYNGIVEKKAKLKAEMAQSPYQRRVPIYQRMMGELGEIDSLLSGIPDLVHRYEVLGPDPQRDALLNSRSELEVELARVADKAAAVQAVIAQKEEECFAMSSWAERFTAVEAELAAVSATHRSYLDWRENASLASTADKSQINVKIIKAPDRPGKPATPRLLPILISVFAGIALAFGVVTLIGLLSDEVRTARDVRQTIGVPVLASIMEIE
jgi:uncharacterized protein involved in exopolysaccharide biosynthesis